MVVSRLIRIRMRNISHEVAEQIKTNFIFNFFFENSAIYEIMWKKYCTDGQAADGNMATNTHSVYVIFIARPLRQ